MILKFNEEKLMKMQMEEIMIFFSDLQKMEIFTNDLFTKHQADPSQSFEEAQLKEFRLVRRFSKLAQEISIDNRLLAELKEEYDQIQSDIRF